MQVIHQLWKGRRVRVAGVLDQVAVDCPDDLAGVYQKYWDLVYKRCYATLKDHEAALDATQDVFVQALHCFEDIQNDVVRGLVDLARTISYERRRRPSREVTLAQPPLNGHAADDPAEIAESHRMLVSVWSGLSDVERRYLADKFAGFSFEEIARRNRRALGTVSSNLARAREHVRRMREPMVPGVLFAGAWRRLTDLSRRARSLASDTSLAAAAQPVGTFTVSLTVAGIIAGAVPATSAALAATPRSSMALATATLPGSTDAGAAMASAVVGRQVQTNARSATSAPPARTATRSTLVRLPGNGTASSETPEDVQISTATASPSYAHDHTIVALGYGNQCGCNALLMSTDGGASWAAAAGPANGDQVVLPPAFPNDPAIYVGYSHGAGAGASDYWSPGFGTEFSPIHGLPAGALTLPSGFDTGDPRILVATTTAVWSISPGDSGPARPLLVDTSGASPSVAPAWGSPDVGAMVVTSSRALSGDSTALAVAARSGDELVWACPPRQACSEMTEVPMAIGAALLASPHFASDGTVVAYRFGQIDASVDAGRSFSAVDVPRANTQVVSLGVAATSSGVGLWALVQQGTGWALMAKRTLASPWTEADGGNPAITGSGGHLVVIDAQRVLFLLAQGGLLCSVNGGVAWEARCPSA